MSNWITLVEADVLDALNNAELTAYRGIAKQNGQTDPLPNVITSVTNDVRAACAKKNALNVTGIPASLKNTALDILIYRLANRVAPALAEKRKAAHDEAVARLKDVRSGDHPIEVPDTAADVQFSGGTFNQVDGLQDRRFKRNQTKGL